ncbi:MAG: hypothetical protein COW47_02165 [Candidatus Huberarchaeum crystalense]|uniref:Metal-dependent hydrolase n=1 Tax=Huberarchaeum crystalense TaxID=2014257 RepID=A0A2G9LJY0_HUBC1|nr:metal-dependent hydrolase [archaeon]OIP20624.1 MAG: hypothetical protein AUJ91_00835 [archaeon CG2_30_31_98]PIN66831.1 MAG: hypothetical protein COW69_00370 [Candidatus Huberarchaeum crystalense]NCS98243.1 metal-dependent hydrolase [archaeon]PIV13651.1 MAG: hypothetical protein COS45_01715 [Candidatus Huberarchaeum crystalense]
MLYINHLFFSVVLFVFSLLFFQFSIWKPENLIYLVVVLFFSVFPDFDSANAKFGRKIQFLKWFFKHRGILHSLFGMVFVLFVFYILILVLGVSGINNLLLFGCIGYLSHLIADCLTVRGCALFFPFSKFRLKGFIKTGSFLEYFLVSFFILLTIYFVFNK